MSEGPYKVEPRAIGNSSSKFSYVVVGPGLSRLRWNDPHIAGEECARLNLAHAAGVRAERERAEVLLRELRRHLMEYATTEPEQTADDYRTEDHDQIERIDEYLKGTP